MIFISYDYIVFLAIVFVLYWTLRKKTPQNIMLLVASYIFYGYVHPWFCILMGISTVVDYFASLWIDRYPRYRNYWMLASVVSNLGMLGTFKYFNFFSENFRQLFSSLGWEVHPFFLNVILPVGISFYTFQTLSYVIDVYRGKLKARSNFIDFALFVAFFPHLVAGPIQRAGNLLLQTEKERVWNWERFYQAWPLLISGFFKKLVVAENVAVYCDQVFALQSPSLPLLIAGTGAFAVQILCDFSGYTDIARGSAKLLGFELMENFRDPYLAISPSDFWSRWHISFSSWIRDYLYIPLGGSRVSSRTKFFFVVMVTMGLSGLWHGAAWNFVAWGLYHGLLVFAYHSFGMGGKWQPQGEVKKVLAWATMSCFTLFGWMLFRTSSLGWLWNSLANPFRSLNTDSALTALAIAGLILLYSFPLLMLILMDRYAPNSRVVRAVYFGCILTAIILFAQESAREFIYFQF